MELLFRWGGGGPLHSVQQFTIFLLCICGEAFISNGGEGGGGFSTALHPHVITHEWGSARSNTNNKKKRPGSGRSVGRSSSSQALQPVLPVPPTGRSVTERAGMGGGPDIDMEKERHNMVLYYIACTYKEQGFGTDCWLLRNMGWGGGRQSDTKVGRTCRKKGPGCSYPYHDVGVGGA